MNPFSHASGRRRLAVAGSVSLVVVALGVLVLAGSASSKSPTLNVGRSVKVGARTEAIAVTPRGAPVYELSPETTRHLLCTSRACLSFWPPVKVAHGAKPARVGGLRGRLGTLTRTGFTQLTLNGHPLYTFAEDRGTHGEAHGEGMRTFGGTWHVFREHGAASSTPTSGPTTTSTTTSSNPYGY